MARFLGGAYLLESRIGIGNTGEVWRGRAIDGRPLAVKVLHPALARNPVVVRRLLLARSTLSRIEHPNVVRVHDIVAEADSLCVVMDLVRGEDLRRAQERHGAFDARLVARIGSAVAAGLEAVHRAGVVHADVKRSNVLLDMSVAPAVPRLVDAVLATVLTQAGGQPRGQSGRAEAAVAADLHALGLLLYGLSLGGDPMAAQQDSCDVRRDTGGADRALLSRERPEQLPEALWQVISQLLDVGGDADFRSAGDVAAAFDRVLTAPAMSPAGAPRDKTRAQQLRRFQRGGSFPRRANRQSDVG